MEIQYLTISNFPRGFQNLKNTLNYYNINPIVLDYSYEYGNHSKLIKTYEYLMKLKEEKSLESIIICFFDAHDVLLLHDPKDIINKFLETGKDIIFAAETIFALHDKNTRPYFDYHFQKNYINSGFCLAKANILYKILNVIVPELSTYSLSSGFKSDQRVISDFITRNHLNRRVEFLLDLDIKSKFILNSTCIRDITDFYNLYNSNEPPYFIHIPGLRLKKQSDKYNEIIGFLKDKYHQNIEFIQYPFVQKNI